MCIKRIKNVCLNIVIALMFMLVGVVPASAAGGSLKLTYEGPSTATVGKNITLKVTMSGITGDPVAAAGAKLGIDKSYFKLVSSTPMSAPIGMGMNEDNFIIAGISMSGSGVSGSGVIYTLVLQPLKTGSTTLSFSEDDFADTKSNKVTANLVSKTITISEAVAKSGNNDLKSLSVDGYKLSPSFDKDKTTYTLTVPNDVSSIKVNASKDDSGATISGAGTKTLKVGNNKIQVKVTAANGETKTYTINVTREGVPGVVDNSDKDGDATLKKLYIGGYTLKPSFNKNTNVYTINVGEAVGGLSVDAVPTSSKAKVKVTGNSGWKYGVNTVTIVVTAENGNKNTYIVNVNRKDPNEKKDNKKDDKKPTNENHLSGLTIGEGTLSPAFDKDISTYDVTIPNDVDKLDIKYDKANGNAKVEVIGNDNLKVGLNTIQVKVTAEDGSIRVYTINANKSSVNSNNDLKILSVDGYKLSPSFDKDTLNYKINVDSGTDKLDITAIPENDESKVEITGNEKLSEGKNVVLVKVTDKNGFSKYYQLEVQKDKAEVFGMSIWNFLMWLFLLLGLIAAIVLLILLFKRRKDKDDKEPQAPVTPVIDFKPEFNFGSRNGTDDDVVYKGTLNQGSKIEHEDKKLLDATDFDEYEDADQNSDIFDETITKDELISAIKEGMETKNTDKLKMLLKQDELNQLKKKVKKEKKNRSDRYE